jgi:hypothetical protein
VREIDSNKIVYHSGSWVGFRTFIFRNITNKHCVTILTDIGNRDGTALHKAYYSILMDKPYSGIYDFYKNNAKQMEH